MKNRRGISSVVGTVFAIIALATTIGYITYSMNVLDNYNQSVLARNQQITDSASEKFQVTGATFVNNKLNITVTNTGTLPVNFTKIWITNSSVSPNAKPWVKSYSINTILAPGNTTKNIGQSTSTWLNTGYSYNVKLVTSRGNNLAFPINSVNQQTLDVKTFTSPPTVSNQFDTQLIMTVTNNSTNAGTITNLTPMAPTVDTSTCTPACSATLVSGPIPASYQVLQPGQTATFKWQYTITGAAANTISFSTGIANGGSTNTGSANVVVRDIVSSLTSGSTLQSVGLLYSPSTNTVFMHTETTSVPSSKYQAMPPNADAAGTTKTGFPNMQFFTKNATSGTILLYAGTMNASFRYTNDRLASGVSDNSDAGHILHFNKNYCQTLPCDRPMDSTQNGNNQCYSDVENTVSGQPSSNTNRPTVSSAFGINGSNGANFNGVQWYTINTDSSCNSPGNSKFSITAWFNANTNGPAASKQTIWRLGTAATNFYEVVLGDGTSGNKGRVYFTFNGGGVSTQCSSTSTTYMDGKWHHLAAVRTGDYSCQLYIDGTLQSGPGATGSSGNNISPSGPVSIGRFPSTSQTCCTNPYYGSLDDVLFWNNNHQLSSSEVTSVKNTNYGTGAFTAGFVLDKTDKNGVKLSNIIPLTLKGMPFSDKEHWSSSTSNSPDRQYYWAGGNFSIILPQITLNPGERLNFTFYKSSGLNADVRLDDSSFTGIIPDLYSSYIQYKGGNSTLPSYLQYNRCNPLDVIVYNQGPYGSWVTYQGTRVTFNNIYGTDSYAGIIHFVNGSRLYSNQDSMLLPVGSTNTFEFYPISNIPNQNNNNYCTNNPPFIAIPDGTYDMNLFISGFDENGGSFLRQVSFGTVTVYG